MATLAPGLRKALLAGGIAAALTGGGAAAVWAGTQPGPSPSGTSATPSPGTTAETRQAEKRGHPIHGEHVVKGADGTFRTVVTQTGTIEAVSASGITVRSEDGFTQRYAINADTRIAKIPVEASDQRRGNQQKGKGRPSLPSATAADLKTGDTVRLSGTKDGEVVTATRIVAGEWPAMKGNGLKRGHGPK
ncbi:DUF5666 domain-containing protein [Paenarthrobacter sp. NPDC089322]|uniref:DUF5666 domain-containing protein n=1 Tax=Paenarthrobacter sp. NPDC089322 TaxID=3155065 RepID=UPI00341CA29A